jgi:opacity protein-like surface antigen
MRVRAVVLAALILAVFVPAASAQAPAPTPAPQQVVTQYKELGPDHYFVFYWNRNSGGDFYEDVDRESSDGFGISYTFWGRGIFSAELDYNYNPQFFGDESEYSTNNMMTFTASGIIGPWFEAGSVRIRPYAIIGGGLMRSTIDEFVSVNWKSTKNKGIVDAGGGLLVLFTRNVGIRADARYRMGVGANNSDDGWGMIDSWNFLRFSAGLALAF